MLGLIPTGAQAEVLMGEWDVLRLYCVRFAPVLFKKIRLAIIKPVSDWTQWNYSLLTGHQPLGSASHAEAGLSCSFSSVVQSSSHIWSNNGKYHRYFISARHTEQSPRIAKMGIFTSKMQRERGSLGKQYWFFTGCETPTGRSIFTLHLPSPASCNHICSSTNLRLLDWNEERK